MIFKTSCWFNTNPEILLNNAMLSQQRRHDETISKIFQCTDTLVFFGTGTLWTFSRWLFSSCLPTLLYGHKWHSSLFCIPAWLSICLCKKLEDCELYMYFHLQNPAFVPTLAILPQISYHFFYECKIRNSKEKRFPACFSLNIKQWKIKFYFKKVRINDEILISNHSN